MSQVVLEVQNLTSAYGPVEVIHNLSLNVNEGELVALVGANGAGKTTILRCISAVQPINSGEIRFYNQNISSQRADSIVHAGISHCPEGRQVFAPLSVEDNLQLGAYPLKIDKAERALAIEEVYDLFPILKEKAKQSAGTLSGGQQQMLAIGRSLMARPRLLLLDEPSMGLAPLLVEEIFNIIKKLNEQGTTILLVEQNAKMALSIANRGYVIETGKVFMSADADKLLADESIQQAYLGH